MPMLFLSNVFDIKVGDNFGAGLNQRCFVLIGKYLVHLFRNVRKCFSPSFPFILSD